MNRFRPPISRKGANVFWLNGAMFVLSLVVVWFQNAPPALKAFSITGDIGPLIQAALFVFSSLIGMVLTSVERVHEGFELAVEGLKKDTSRFRQELARGIVEYQGQSYRSLRFIPGTGSVYYGSVTDSNRNILFNNETFKKVLQAAQNAKCGDDAVMVKQRPLLYALGFAASSRFALHFQQHIEAKGLSFDLATWLHEWTVYDSDAGFGRMEATALEGDEAKVVIKNSFLTHGSDHGGPSSLCDFMVGYIEGLLKGFAAGLYKKYGLNRAEIRVRHDPGIDCFHEHEDPEIGCVFWVEVPVIRSN